MVNLVGILLFFIYIDQNYLSCKDVENTNNKENNNELIKPFSSSQHFVIVFICMPMLALVIKHLFISKLWFDSLLQLNFSLRNPGKNYQATWLWKKRQKKGKLYTIKVIKSTFYLAQFYPYGYAANLIVVRKSDLKKFQDKS